MENKTNKTTETIANKALAGAAVPQTGEGVAPTPSTASVKSLRYKPGMYRSDKFMRVIKELTHTHSRDENGKVQKTYGTWANDKNMIVFQKGVERSLTEEDLKLPAVQRLIDSKTIFRVGE